jgi:hypothetical protein
MFLEEKEQDAQASAEAIQKAFDATPQVWSGKVCRFMMH